MEHGLVWERKGKESPEKIDLAENTDDTAYSFNFRARN